jgi:predicted acetyltransferase
VTVSIELLRAGDAPARRELGRLAFGTTDPVDASRPVPPDEQVVAGYLDDQLCAAATFHDDAQWICGRRVPMGGVAGVAVAPHVRGHGFARAVLSAGLHLMHRRGDAISTLYPTTGTLYRSLGWGYAGAYAWHRVPLAELPSADELDGYEIVPAGVSDARPLYNAVAPTHNGWLGRSAMYWIVAEYDHERSPGAHGAYRLRRDGVDAGFLAYTAVREGTRRFEVSATELCAIDRDAYRAVFALVQSMGSMAQALRTRLPAYVLQATLDHPHRVEPLSSHPFMCRVVDAAAAVAARGYSPHLDAEVHLDLHDPDLTHNDGPFVLRVRDGQGTLEPGGSATVGMSIGDFSTALVGGPCLSGPLVGLFAAATPPTLVDFF